MEARRERLDYEIDGIVVKLDALAPRARLGFTAHHPRWALAWKFEPRSGETRLEAIVVQVGRTGVLTPVALLRPVDVSGVTVSRATLHNRRELERRDFRVGDRVRVRRAGDVIPEIAGRIPGGGRRGRRFRFPTRCPACGTRLETRGPQVVCPNRFGCPAQLKRALVHLGATDALDIEGLGEETATALVDAGLVRTLPDLFRVREAQLLRLPRFASTSARNLLDAIQDSRSAPLDRLLIALGIPGVGKATARDLAARFGSLEALARATPDELRGVKGIGHRSAAAIARFLGSARTRRLLRALRAAGVRGSATTTSSGPLAGQRIVFTGTLAHFSRREAEQAVEALGATTADTVGRDTTMVVVGADPGSKAERARVLGVPRRTESQFRALLRSPRHK